jgi:cytochrome P450
MQAVGGLLAAQLTQARPGGLLSGIANLPLFDPPDNTHPNAIGITMPAAQVEHIANATSLVLGGFFPTEWLVQRATVHLLDARASNLQTAAKAGVTAQQCLDELLRFDTPLQMSDRFVHADGVEIHGVALPKNACVVVLWGSANRDEAAFGPDANTVNFARGKGPAWGFGGTGEHRCVGQTLANKVVGAAIDALLAMADYPPHLTQGYGAAWSVGPYFRRLESLMVTFP